MLTLQGVQHNVPFNLGLGCLEMGWTRSENPSCDRQLIPSLLQELDH